MNGLLGQLPPGLRGYQAQRQFDMQEQNQQLGQATGLLNMRNAVVQQQQAQKDQELKGLLGQKLAAGDQEGAKALLMQYKPELFAKSMIPQQPKWQVTERYNDQTGRAEKVMIDMNDPTKVMPFGGQKAPTMTFGPDGVARDMSSVAPGTVAQDPSKTVVMGPNGPMVNPLAVQARSEIARAGRPQVNTTILPPQKTFENEDKLRADFSADPVVKASSEMDTAFKMIDAAYKRPSAANDLAMATKYMKILDPTSVVRESEFALAVNATGLLDKVQNYSAAVLEGKKLNPTQRKDFYESAKAINDAFQAKRKDVEAQYSEMATGYGLNPKNVIPSLRGRHQTQGPKFLGFE